MLFPPTEHDAFLRAICDDPDDDAPRLVYADWLDEHGEPERAEFIRVQCQLARLGRDATPRRALEKRERHLLRSQEQVWLQELPAALRKEVVFRRGFVEYLHCTALEFLKAADALFRAAAVLDVRMDYVVRRLVEVAQSPYLARLRGLDLDAKGSKLSTSQAQSFFASARLPRLADLELGYSSLGPEGAAALAANPTLSRLTHLDLSINRIGEEGAAALAGAEQLAGLTCLQLYDNRVGDEGVTALASSPYLVRLTGLHLIENRIGDAGAEALASWPLLGRLSELFLGYNPIGDPGARALLDSPYLGPHTTLDLRATSISPATADALRQRFGDRIYLD